MHKLIQLGNYLSNTCEDLFITIKLFICVPSKNLCVWPWQIGPLEREVTVKGSKVAMRVKQEGKEVVFWQWVWKGFIQTSPLTLFSNFRCILLPLYFNLHVDSPPPPLFLNWNIWQSGIISRLKKKKKSFPNYSKN